MKTKRLALDAMLAAMCAVLGYLALDTGNLKITFESLPVLLAGMVLGPLDGLAVGAVGTGIYQLARYGVSATTPLWIAPYALAGALTGFFAKRRGFSLTGAALMGAVTAAEGLITLLNTVTLYIDSKLFGYYFPGFIAGSLALRLAICVGKSVVFSLVLPRLIGAVKKARTER